MTLPFSTIINGQPTYFVEKIWSGIGHNKILHYGHFLDYEKFFEEKFKTPLRSYPGKIVPPKLHTIREDSKDRWKAGRDIHFVIENPYRFQFAPVVKCVSTQKIEIKQRKYIDASPFFIRQRKIIVLIDGIEFFHTSMGEKGWDDMRLLAHNDGFNSVEDFFSYFNKDFTGKIIHWTDLKY